MNKKVVGLIFVFVLCSGFPMTCGLISPPNQSGNSPSYTNLPDTVTSSSNGSSLLNYLIVTPNNITSSLNTSNVNQLCLQGISLLAITNGVLSPLPSSLLIDVSGGGNALGVSTNPSCTKTASTLTIPQNMYSIQFNISVANTGTYIVTLSDPSGVYASTSLVVQINGANQVGGGGNNNGGSGNNNGGGGVVLSNPPSPQSLVVLTPSAQISDESWVPITLSLLGDNQTQASFTSPQALSLSDNFSDPSSSFSLSSDGTTPLPATFPAQTSSLTLFFHTTHIGVTTIQAQAGGLAGSNMLTTVAGPASQLVITGPSSLLAGTYGGFKIFVTDSLGNPTTLPSPLSVSLSGISSFYQTEGSPISSIVIPTSGQTQFSVESTIGGEYQLTGTVTSQSSGIALATFPLTILSNSANSLVLSPQSQNTSTYTIGNCIGFTLGITDMYGNSQNSGTSGIKVTLSQSGLKSGLFYNSMTDCTSNKTNSITQILIPPMTSQTSLYFAPTSIGEGSLLAEAPPLNPASYALSSVAGLASQIVLTKTTPPPVAGVCSQAFTFSFTDAFGDVVSPQGELSLSTQIVDKGNAVLYSDPQCQSPTQNGFSIQPHQGSGSLYITDTKSETITATLFETPSSSSNNSPNSNASLSPGTQSQFIGPNTEKKLVFMSTTPTQGVVHSCYGMTLGVYDAYQNPTIFSSTSQTPIQLSGEESGGFYSDLNCSLPLSEFAFAEGSGTATFFFKTDKEGTYTIQALAQNLSAVQPFVVLPGSAQVLVMTGPSTGTAASIGCSAGPFTLSTQDQYGNPAPLSSNATISIQTILANTPVPTTFPTTPPNLLPFGGTWFSDAQCQTPLLFNSASQSYELQMNGGSSQSSPIYYQLGDLNRSSLPLFTNYTSPNLTGNSNLLTIYSGPPHSLALAPYPPYQIAGSCPYPFELVLVDANGNPATVTSPVSVSLGHSGAGYFSNLCGNNIPVSNITFQGNSAGIYFNSTKSGIQTLSFTPSGIGGTSFILSINPGPPNSLIVSNSNLVLSGCVPNTPITYVNTVSEMNAQTYDIYGNYTTFPGVPLQVYSNPGNLVDNTSGSNPSQTKEYYQKGFQSFYYDPTTIGQASVTATYVDTNISGAASFPVAGIAWDGETLLDPEVALRKMNGVYYGLYNIVDSCTQYGQVTRESQQWEPYH